MTPYAILLVKDTDPDEVIRNTYWVFAKQHHPDVPGNVPVEWTKYTDAYTLIKTKEAREALAKKQGLLSGFCDACKGTGVQGTRMFKGKIKVCTACNGEGRK